MSAKPRALTAMVVKGSGGPVDGTPWSLDWRSNSDSVQVWLAYSGFDPRTEYPRSWKYRPCGPSSWLHLGSEGQTATSLVIQDDQFVDVITSGASSIGIPELPAGYVQSVLDDARTAHCRILVRTLARDLSHVPFEDAMSWWAEELAEDVHGS